MSFDIKYRPKRYDDVVGQEGVVRVLREIVKSGRGFQQSYLFAGPHGSSKTTNARIFARSLLCHSPENGEGCGHCSSCRDFDAGTTPDFVEVDAATNSGKADMKRIVDSLDYATLSGRRTLYLFDESHRLTPDALDAILKPMEDPIPGSESKQLVCLFCTTEPERMRETVLSRCAPTFVIRKPPVDAIIRRLAFVCQEESIPFEESGLRALVEVTKSHMRDALKGLDGISLMPGGATFANVSQYLHLDSHRLYLSILLAMGKDASAMVEAAEELFSLTSASVAYDRMLEVVMVAHRCFLAVGKVPSYMDVDKIREIAETHGEYLLQIAERLASRPARPTHAVFLCDIGALHHLKRGGITFQTSLPMHSAMAPSVSPAILAKAQETMSNLSSLSQDPSVDFGSADAVYAPLRAMARSYKGATSAPQATPLYDGDQMTLDGFFELLAGRIRETRSKNGRAAANVDSR